MDYSHSLTLVHYTTPSPAAFGLEVEGAFGPNTVGPRNPVVHFVVHIQTVRLDN